MQLPTSDLQGTESGRRPLPSAHDLHNEQDSVQKIVGQNQAINLEVGFLEVTALAVHLSTSRTLLHNCKYGDDMGLLQQVRNVHSCSAWSSHASKCAT